MNHVFGPVPSRRLGLSLGVDCVYKKVCTLDCIYCQAGVTTNKTIERKKWVDPDEIVKELRRAIKNMRGIDYVTFSGSGEPTLHESLEYLIMEAKACAVAPIAVLTNATLMHLPEVRAALLNADLVVPSLDAGTPETFARINRPHAAITFDMVMQGLTSFRRVYSGKLWLEIMLVQGVNDTEKEMHELARKALQVEPDKIQLTTVFRPAPTDDVLPVREEAVRRYRELFGEKAEFTGAFSRVQIPAEHDEVTKSVLALLRRRPCTVEQIHECLGIHETVVVKLLLAMEQAGTVTKKIHNDGTFYSAL